jgi:hypothetical protein
VKDRIPIAERAVLRSSLRFPCSIVCVGAGSGFAPESGPIVCTLSPTVSCDDDAGWIVQNNEKAQHARNVAIFTSVHFIEIIYHLSVAAQ